MRPVVFNGHAGWLHDAEGGEGVVLCNPAGHEAMWLHQAIRHLAIDLAARGVPVLRFDYLGTGDSADTGDWLRPAQWAAEAADAVNYLKRETSVERVSLAGFRLGATVAALTATLTPVQSLVMLAPVVSMRLFMREMGVLHQTWREKARISRADAVPAAGAHDIFGHRFSQAGLQALRDLDLCKLEAPPVQRVLIAHSGLRDGSANLAEHWSAQGLDVTSIAFENYLQMLQPPWLTETPDTTLCSVADWLAKNAVPRTQPARAVSTVPPVLALQGAVESPLRIGDGRLFGVLCEPTRHRGPQGHGSVLLIANTGATHHVGDGRFGVELARQVAQLGHASLRIDADGIGESLGAIHTRVAGQTAYGAMAADLSHAANWLVDQGYDHVVVVGICAGAYAGLRAATLNPAVRGLVLVNPASFLLPEDCTIQGATQRPRGSPRAHLRSMIRAAKWSQVVRGEVQLRPVLHTMWRHALAQVQAAIATLSRDTFYTSTPNHQVRSMFKRLDASGVRVRLVFSLEDHSLDEFYMYFGIGGRSLRRMPYVKALVFPGMDHEVLNRGAREHVLAACHAVLSEVPGALEADGAHGALSGAATDPAANDPTTAAALAAQTAAVTAAASHEALDLNVSMSSKLSSFGKQV